MTALTKSVESSKDGKTLILFNDKSGSMSGEPFKALKEGCLSLKDELFNAKDKCSFEKVFVNFYDDRLVPKEIKKMSEYVSHIQNMNIGGMTNFTICMEEIYQQAKRSNKGDELSIVFFTDG